MSFHVPLPSCDGRPTETTTVRPTSPLGQPWDPLSERERRLRLEGMDPHAVRSFAASMPAIEQAKGILMGCYGIDAAAAFALLQRVSSSRNVKLRALAAAVVAAVSSTGAWDQRPPVAPAEHVGRAIREVLVGDPDLQLGTSLASADRESGRPGA